MTESHRMSELAELQTYVARARSRRSRPIRRPAPQEWHRPGGPVVLR